MIYMLRYVVGMLRILTNEVVNLDDGEERRIAAPARNDREEAVA